MTLSLAPLKALWQPKITSRRQLTSYVVVTTLMCVAVALAFVLLSVGFAIVLLPVMAVAWLVARWRLNQMADALRKGSEGPQQAAPDQRTIEVEYRVIDRDKAEPK